MFESKEKLKARIEYLEIELRSKIYTKAQAEEFVLEKQREIDTLKHAHGLEVETLKFEMKNFKDSEILAKDEKIIELTNANAVLVKENEMLNKMTDINADIIDVKELVSSLIEKLPTVNINSLSVASSKE